MRYGQFKYSEAKYGSSPANANLLWALEVDWDGDGIFDGSNEAGRMMGLKTRRGREFFLSSGGDGFEPFREGEFTAVLDNEDGRYDPYNTGSPLYGNVRPGRRVRLRVKNGNTGTLYDIMAGSIDDIVPFREDGRGRARLVVKDGWRSLYDHNVRIAVQENLEADDLIGMVLDEAEWPWDRDLGLGADAISYWWARGGSAASEIRELVDSELGRFFIASDGKAVYRSRHADEAAVLSLTQSQLRKDIDTPQPWEFVRNTVRMPVYPRVRQATGVLWQLEDTPLVGSGRSLTVFADFLYNDESVPALGLITPVPTTDFLVNTQADGLGTDLTSQCTVTMTAFGETSLLNVANNSGLDGYITFLRIRGDALSLGNTSAAEQTDSASRTSYGPRTFTLDTPWHQDTNVANDLCTLLLDFLAEGRPFPVVQVESRPDVQFAPDLMDRVSLAIARLGIDDDFRVGMIEHEWLEPTGQAVLTTWRMEPFFEISGYWIFTTQIGVTSVFGI